MQQAIDKRISNPYLRQMFRLFLEYIFIIRCASCIIYVIPYATRARPLVCRRWNPSFSQCLGKASTWKEGVAIHTGARVDNIKTYQRRVTGVRLDTGEFVKADYIISNMEVIPTL